MPFAKSPTESPRWADSSAINTFVSGVDLERYASELLLQSAVERQLQNIGEALSQLSRLDPVLGARVPRQRQLIGFRNVLVHGYAGLNNAEVWRVLRRSNGSGQILSRPNI